ncbi:MAG: hypothetical protein DWQ31_15270 [Planctomycetota bacterium]|nr:MAG: hypothetical protein DWQ31_15270 [Planctomycetota bacterium]
MTSIAGARLNCASVERGQQETSVSEGTMGIVNMGVPTGIVLELARLHRATAFVETGTFHGTTTRWASDHFEIVHTIERAQGLYDLHSQELAKIEGVTPHLGDSRDVLPQIVRELGDRRAVHWLDGHWSGGETAGESDECPLLDELRCLSGRADDILLIDDARLFMSAPPPPHEPAQWPTTAEICDALPKAAKRPIVQIIDDVIFVVPDEEALRHRLVAYAQDRAKTFWEEFGRLQRGRSSPAARWNRLLTKVKRRMAAG